MNILFCVDKNVCDGIFLSTLSILKNTNEKLNIYILTASTGSHSAIPQDFAHKLQASIDETHAGSEIILLDISDIFNKYLPTANMGTRFTPLCMLRLFADMLPEIPDRILYLDTDVLCRKDFKDFYYLDISNVEIAGVPDRYGKWFFGNIFLHDYFNSGVLLMNMSNIRKSGLFEKCRCMCRDKKMFMPDQSALNKLCKKKIICDRRYNEQRKLRPDTVFQHFTTSFRFIPYFHSVSVKPWNIKGMHESLKLHEYDELFDEYLKIKENIKNEH